MRTTTVVVILALLSCTAERAFAQEGDTWRKVAEAIPLGTKVKIRTLEGRRIIGTLMRVDGEGVLMKKGTRLPEPAVTISFDRITSIEKETGGIHVGKAIAIGVATGAGMLLTMIVFAMQLD